MSTAVVVTSATAQPLAYAFALGLVAPVNPCGFPLLPAYLAAVAGEGRGAPPLERTIRGLAAGAGVSAGFVLVFGVLGLAVEAGARIVENWVPWAMVPVGAALAVIGTLAALGRPLYARLAVPRLRSPHHAFAVAGFGAAYAVSSLSCSLPVFLAGVAGSFTRLGLLTGAENFIAYALGMGVLLCAASLVVAHAGTAALRRALPLARAVPRVVGVVLALVGAYLVLYWVSDLTQSSPAPVQAVESLQSALSAWLAGSARLVSIVLGGAVVVALVSLAVAGRPAGAARRRQP
jgi:cytochrome c-type biogenesis protein